MSKLKIKVNGMSMEAAGGDDFIQREREAFSALAQQSMKDRLNINIIPRFGKVGVDEKLEATLCEKADEYDADEKSGGCVVKKHKTTVIKSDWKEVEENVRRNAINVGDTVSCALTNGEEAEFVVTEITDEHVRFESVGFIGDAVSWNSEDTNRGGYPESDIKEYVDNTIWGLLPEDLRAVISDTTREWKDKDGNKGTYETKLFLPAASEVFDKDSCYGDEELYEQLEWYKNIKNRIRVDEDGDTRNWWLASVRSGGSTNACDVSSNGYANSWYATSELRVPVCFQISKISKSL